jgi:hypothetical protein
VRIVWNSQFKQFEAQINGDFKTEQEAIKEAGFRGEGPPEWKWVAFRAAVLTKLKESKLNLTITTEALEHYNRLKAQDDANKAVLDQLKEAKKKLKKEEKQTASLEEYRPDELEHGEFSYVKIAPGEPILNKYIRPKPPLTLCSICQTPVYYYECQEPLLCLDCEFAEEL